MQRADVVLDDPAVWTIPRQVTKNKKHTRQVPLVPAAVALIPKRLRRARPIIGLCSPAVKAAVWRPARSGWARCGGHPPLEDGKEQGDCHLLATSRCSKNSRAISQGTHPPNPNSSS
jgi:hypothetical protein